MHSLREHMHLMHVTVFASLILLVLVMIITWQPSMTAQVLVAQGGQITGVNISITNPSTHWLGIYGTILSDNSTNSVNESGGQVLQVNLSYDTPTSTTRIVSANGMVDWNNLSVASLTSMNSYMGLAPINDQSATNTFTSKTNFTLEGVIYETWSTQTLAVNGIYITGALESNGTLLFITRYVSGGLGFEGTPTDYQLLLPIHSSGQSNYTFYVFENDSFPSSSGTLSCNVSFNLQAQILTDNISVLLDWDDIPGIDGYDVSYIDGPSQGFLDFSSASVVDVGTNSFWVDSDNSSQRYYKVEALQGGTSCLSNETAGTLVLELSAEYNLISNPFIQENNSVSEVLKTASGSYDSIFEYANDEKIYNYYIIFGQNVISNFNTIEQGKGYWVRATQEGTLRLAGIATNNLSESFSPEYNLFGNPVITNNEHNETIKYVLQSIEDSYDSIFRFNNNDKIYSYYIKFGQNVISDFDTLDPGKGYWIQVHENATAIYEND